MKILLCLFALITASFANSSIALSEFTGFALLSDSTMVTYGENNAATRDSVIHPLGYQTLMDYNSSKWLSINSTTSTKDNFAALSVDSTIYTWGDKGSHLGQNGAKSSTPTQISTEKFIKLKSNATSICAIKSDSSMWYFGTTSFNGLENSDTLLLIDDTKKWIKTYSFERAVAGIDKDSNLWVMGNNQNATLGLGHENEVSTFTQLGTDKWISIEIGYTYSFGIKADGTLWSWGKNHGQFLSESHDIDVIINEPVLKNTNVFTEIQYNNGSYVLSGEDSLLYLMNNGTNGLPNNTRNYSPVLIDSLLKVKSYSLGIHNLAFISVDDKIYNFGEIADHIDHTSIIPELISNSTFTQIQGGNNFLFLKGENNYIWGTGNNQNVFFAGPEYRDDKGIHAASNDPFLAIANSHYADHMFAIKDDSSLWVMGDNDDNVFGHNDTLGNRSAEWVQVDPSNKWSYAFAGEYYSLAIDASHNLYSWGSDEYGHLGNGDGEDPKNVPTQISIGNKFSKACVTEYISAALGTDSTFWGWGDQLNGINLDGVLLGEEDPREGYPDIGEPQQFLPNYKWIDLFCDYEGLLLTKSDSTIWYNGDYKDDFGLDSDNDSIQSLGSEKYLKALIFEYTTVYALALDSTLWSIGENHSTWTQLGTKRFVDIETTLDGLALRDHESYVYYIGHNNLILNLNDQSTLNNIYEIVRIDSFVTEIDTLILQEDFADVTISLNEYLITDKSINVEILENQDLLTLSGSSDSVVLESNANQFGSTTIRLILNPDQSLIEFSKTIFIEVESVIDTLVNQYEIDLLSNYEYATIDTIIEGNLDTSIISKDYKVDITETYSVTDTLFDQLLHSSDSLHIETVNDTTLLDSVRQVFIYKDTTVVETPFTNSVLDTVISIDSLVNGELDTVITTITYETQLDSNFLITDSLEKDISFYLDTALVSVTLDSIMIDSSEVIYLADQVTSLTPFGTLLEVNWTSQALYINNRGSESRLVFLYTINGQLLKTLKLHTGQNEYSLPSHLRPQQLYLKK